MMKYEVKGYNDGEQIIGACFDSYIEAKAFANNCRFATCDIWLTFNGRVVCEM